MNKRLIIFIDSGDTIIDESTQVLDARGIVTHAELISGAGEMLQTLHQEGFLIALVADGECESFENVYRENGLGGCFDARIISEAVGCQKPGLFKKPGFFALCRDLWRRRHELRSECRRDACTTAI